MRRAYFAGAISILAVLCSIPPVHGQVLSREQTLKAAQDALRGRNYAQAIRLLEDGQRRFPDDLKLKVELGQAYLYDRQDDRAMQLFRDVLRVEPSNRKAKLQLARALGYRRDYQASNQLYRELLQANPDDELASEGLIRNLMHQKRTAEARRELTEALTRHPNSPRLQDYKRRLDQRGKRSGEAHRERKPPETAGWKRRGRLEATGAYLTDSASNRSWRSSQRFDHDIGRALTGRLEMEERLLWKSGGPKAKVLSGTAGLRLPLTPFLSLAADGGAVRFADGSSRPLYGLDLELHPTRRLWLTAGFSRNPIYPTFRATQFNLLAHGWHTHVEWNPGHWRLNVRGSRLHYSDGNRMHREGGELLRLMGDSSLALLAGYRFNHLAFNQNLHHGYFSPSGYQSHLGVGGVRFRVGKSFRGEYLARVGAESISGQSYRPAWELALRNRMMLGNWELGGDYFYYHLAQATGAFRAHAPRVLLAYHF